MTTIDLASPSGGLSFTLLVPEDGAAAYTLRAADRAIFLDSPLCLDLRPGGLLGQGMHILCVRRRTIDETYCAIASKASQIRNHCNEMTVSLREQGPGQRCLDLVVRAYDDGVAFRYVVPKPRGVDSVLAVAERTEFRFTADHACWPTTYPHFRSSFEEEYPKRTLSQLHPGQLVGLPLVVQVEGGPSVAILEAALVDYPGMYLEASRNGGTGVVSRLAPLADGSYGCARSSGSAIVTPWRVIQVADAPAKLIESNILYNLNEPCAISDTRWIKPGKVTWDWWSDRAAPGKPFEGQHSTDLMKHYVDFAADMKLEYMLVDGGWYRPINKPGADVTKSIPELDLPELVRYANAKGVDIMVWLYWSDLPAEQFDRAFAFYESLNIRGIKVDFFDRDDQDVVRHISALVEAAAHHHLVVDLHGVYKPTGIERTWPNLMTHEGILGAEYNKWSKRVTPEHNVTIPFTRMLAGPMDYTPGAFDNATKEAFVARQRYPMVMGTRCHNLAMYVIYQSGLQMVSDYPDAIRGKPGADFLKDVPAAWDETVALAGEVGQYIALARRRGNTWFIGAMTNAEPRTLTLPTTHLGSGNYTVTLYSDGPNAVAEPEDMTITTRKISAGERLEVNLAPAGGFAATVRRA